MSTIQGAITESSQLEKDKVAYNTERLQLDRLESDRRAAHDAQMLAFLMQMGNLMKAFINKN